MALYDIVPITPENLSTLEPLYTDFQAVAQTEYGWPSPPVDFASLSRILNGRILHGYLLLDYDEDRPVGFLLYQIEAYGSLEVKVIYMENDVPVKVAMDLLMRRFVEDIKDVPGWDVVSYPMLGAGQARYIHYITWYGFKPVGQAVVKFHMLDGISIEIFQKQQFTPLPEGYRFSTWEPKYEEGVVDVLTEAFSDSVDALWDPRFRNRDGMREALAFVQSGGYGIFWPECTSILLNREEQPVGVCLLNVVGPEEANIPLIGLLKSERHHKLGRTLLAKTVERCVNATVNGQLKLATISATVATGNIPAIRMYRHTAFQEDHWYSHIYQERSSVLTRKAGQWC